MQQLLEENKASQEEIIDLSHYFRVLKKSWLSISLFAILVTSIAVLVVLSITPKYTATATLLIEAQEKRAVSIEEVVGIDSSQAEYYLTQFEILKSNQIAQKVIDELKLTELVEFNSSLNNEKTIIDTIKEIPLVASLLNPDSNEGPTKEGIRQSVLKAFKENLVISPIRKTQLVKISFTSQDPELAAKIANSVGYAYIDINLEARVSTTEYASSWITTRLVELRDQLAASEKALSDFLVKEKLIDDSGIQSLASQELANLTQRLAEVRDKRIETESTYTALRSVNVTDVASLSAIPSISSHPQVIAIRQAEIDAVNNVTELSKRYGPKHDKMRAANAKLNSAQEQARSITKKLINGIGKELQAVKKQESLITREIDSRKGEFQEITVKKSRYEALKREVATNRNVLNVFLTRQKETTATSDFESANARFTDEALIPQIPSAPKKKLIVVLSLLASLGFATILVFSLEVIKNTVDTAKNLEERLGIVPLGVILKIKNKKLRKNGLDSKLFFNKNESIFSETIRSIRTSLLLNENESMSKKLAITSALPSEGKTTVAINLAMSFAQVEKVILVDCDLRKPSIAKRFGLKKYQQGLTNHLLMGIELSDCLYKDEQSGLTILPAGMLTTNPQELLSSHEFLTLLESLGHSFDRVVVDTPPILPVSDSLIISKVTKQTILVVKANYTKIEVIKRALSKLIGHKVILNGVILNQVLQKNTQTDYGYESYNVYGENN